MKDNILKQGVIYYLLKVDKNVNPKNYEPCSFEQWKMLRDLEPSKFGNDYDFYVKLKEDQFKQEQERRENCSLDLHSVMYSLYDSDIDSTRDNINKIESNILFKEWVKPETIEIIKNTLNKS